MTADDLRRPGRWNTVTVPARVAERAHSRRTEASGGCWISDYSTTSAGYAQVGWQDGDQTHMVLAHRAAWVHEHGQVPMGLTLDHTCKNRRCVRPSHLRLLSNYENARRNNGTDWPIGTCSNGHPSTDLREVKRRRRNGETYTGLKCGTCARENGQRWVKNNPDKRREAVRKSNSKRRAA